MYEKAQALLDGGPRPTEGRGEVPASAFHQRPSLVELFLSLGDVLILVGRSAEAEERYRAVLERGGGAASAEARAQLAPGQLLEKQGEYAAALGWLAEAQVRCEALGEQGELGQALATLGLVHARQGRYAVGQSSLEQGLVVQRAIGDQAAIAMSLGGIAAVRGTTGDADQAARLAGAVMGCQRAWGGSRRLPRSSTLSVTVMLVDWLLRRVGGVPCGSPPPVEWSRPPARYRG